MKKIVFIAFAIEDQVFRDFFSGQREVSEIEFVDYSVKEAYDYDWKNKVRARIQKSDGVIVLLSKNSFNSTGQKWEVECAVEERKKIIGMYVRHNQGDFSNPYGIPTMEWSWSAIRNFISSL